MKHSEIDLFSGVVPFVTTAEALSFGAAARKLGLTPSAVSKAITRLETKLGVRLLNRTSRSVSLTDEGHTFLRASQEAVANLRTAGAQLSLGAREPRGTLLVSLPLMLGKLVILPALQRLNERYPALVVQATLTDRFVSLAEENLDAVVRIGTLPNSRLAVHKLRRARWVTVASPVYLARRGVPRTPLDLSAHNCLKFLLPNGLTREWEFSAKGGPTPSQTVVTRGTLIADHGEGLVEAALAGLGIFQAHDYVVSEALARGRLVEILADYKSPGPPISLLLSPGKRSSPKVRAFAHLVQELLGQPQASDEART